MNQMIGADVAELQQLAAQFTAAANRLRATAGHVDGGIRVSAWVGPVAIRFRLAWDTEHSRAVKDVAQALEDAGRRLAQEASDQEAASGASTGSTTPMRGPDARGVGPDSAQDLWRGVKDAGDDGVKVVEVTDAEGNKRYIVYVGGTQPFSTGENGATENIPATLGHDSATETQIRKAMEKIPENAEIMMVGYSQGGIHAENIAADDHYNIKTVVTFGSPNSSASVGNRHGADVVRFVDDRDVVPYLTAHGTEGTGAYTGPGAGGDEVVRRTLADAVVRPVIQLNPLTDTTPKDVVSLARDAVDGAMYAGTGALVGGVVVHTNDRTYDTLAEDFDDSAAQQHDRSKESMGRFLGGTAREVG